MQGISKKLIFTLFFFVLFSASPLWAASSMIGRTADDFSLKGNDARNHRLSELRGNVVMLNFWATWCGPCREEMPPMDALYQRYKSLGFVVVGVNIDDNREAAEKMVKQLDISYPILFDTDKSVSKLYRVNAMPTTVIIDCDGKVRHVHFGYKSEYMDTYQAEVRTLLSERGH